MSRRDPTTAEALAEAKRRKRWAEIESEGGHLYAAPRSAAHPNVWNIRVRGDNHIASLYVGTGTKVIATVATRCKRAVLDVLNAMERHHLSGDLL